MKKRTKKTKNRNSTKKSLNLISHPLDLNHMAFFPIKPETLFQAHLRMGRCFLHFPKRFSGLMSWQVLSQVLQELGKHRNLTPSDGTVGFWKGETYIVGKTYMLIFFL